MVDQIILSNGLAVLHVKTPSTEVSSAIFLTRGASRFELPTENGLARFTAIMSMKSTPEFTEVADISRALDSVGCFLNFEVSREYSAFYVKSETLNFDKALNILSQIVVYPIFKDEDIKTEKQLFTGEIQNRQKDPGIKALDELYKLVYGGNSLSHPGVGEISAVNTFTQNSILNFRKNFYNGTNSVLVISSHKPLDISELEKLFGVLESGNYAEYEAVSPPQNATRTATFPSSFETSSLAVGFPAYPRGSEQKHTQILIDVMLGKTKSSGRLQSLYKEKGLISGISANIFQFSETGLFAIQFVSPNATIRKAYERVIEEITKFTSEKVIDAELELAKQYYKGTLVLDMNDPVERGFFHGLQKLLENKVEPASIFMDKLFAVTPDDILNVSQTVFSEENLYAVMVGGGTS